MRQECFPRSITLLRESLSCPLLCVYAVWDFHGSFCCSHWSRGKHRKAEFTATPEYPRNSSVFKSPWVGSANVSSTKRFKKLVPNKCSKREMIARLSSSHSEESRAALERLILFRELTQSVVLWLWCASHLRISKSAGLNLPEEMLITFQIILTWVVNSCLLKQSQGCHFLQRQWGTNCSAWASNREVCNYWRVNKEESGALRVCFWICSITCRTGTGDLVWKRSEGQ